MYIVLEVQVNSEQEPAGVIATSFAKQEEAVSRYHTILAAAAVSNVKKHSAFLLTESGYLASECFEHGGAEE